MGERTLKEIENGRPAKLKMGLAPILIALLLLSQFSLTAAGFAATPTLEINYTSLESDEPDNYGHDADPPAFQPLSAILLPGDEPDTGKINWRPPGSKFRASTNGIRAPPSLLT